MKSSFFFRSKPGIAIPVVNLIILVSTLWAVVAPLWMSVGRSNPINSVTHALSSNSPFKTAVGQYFVTKLKEDASGKELILLNKKETQISTAVTNLLSAPEFKTNIDNITTQIYNYYILGSKQAKTISVKPIAVQALRAFTHVDPQFKRLQKEIDKIKPIALPELPITNGPDLKQIHSSLKQIHSSLNLAFTLISLLLLVLILLYAVFARNRNVFFRTVGFVFLYIGVPSLVIHAVGTAIANSQIKTISDDLVRAAAPIVISQLLSPRMTIGIVFSILGVIGVVLGFIKQYGFPRAIGFVFLSIGVPALVIYAVGTAIANSQIKTISNNLVRDAALIVIPQLLNQLMIIGIVFSILGVIGVGLSFIKQNSKASQRQ